mmetsp:Transcript_21952/g.61365  ORF Transcript_21952/g.61365 Transcript_21952/m.61365 type:complete len:351 (-) Transcript_21952:176-1228(-)
MASSEPLALSHEAEIGSHFGESPSCGPCNEEARSRCEQLQARLDKVTTLGVNISTFAFLGLQVPQITQNFMGDPHQMKSLAWSGFVSGSVGNLLLATYFAGVSEWAAVRVQMIGAITNYFVATQVFFAGYFPAPQFWTLVVVITIGLVIPFLYACGMLSASTFSSWKEATTAIGLAAIAFTFTATFTANSWALLAVAVAGAAIGAVLLVQKTRVAALARLTATLGGWLATFLFMWMPMPEIFKILKEGQKAAQAFSMGFTVLATLGNGLGAARAFVIKDTIWFTGSFWGLVAGGWITAVAVWSVHPAQCPLWALIAYTCLLIVYFAAVLKVNGVAKEESVCRQIAFMFGR